MEKFLKLLIIALIIFYVLFGILPKIINKVDDPLKQAAMERCETLCASRTDKKENVECISWCMKDFETMDDY